MDWESDDLGYLVSRSKVVVLNVDNDNEDVDFWEIVKRWGLTFPGPSWWFL